MRTFALALVLMTALSSAAAQRESEASTASHSSSVAMVDHTGNLPAAMIGKNDLVGVTVYDAPELTRSVRVDANGSIRLPMLQNHIKAIGLYPEDLEQAIKDALVKEQIMVDPIVTVTMLEYFSRPITIMGAVKSPTSFQAIGRVTLLDALSRAGGLAENAGSEILISSTGTGSQEGSSEPITRISVNDLFNSTNDALNIELRGGELVRVPQAGRFYVLGNVKSPGAFQMNTGADTTILKALAMTGGLAPYPAKIAFIYRNEGNAGGKNQVPIELKKIIERKSPDVALNANDILYIPEATGRKNSMSAAKTVAMFGAALGTTLLYIYR